MLVAWSELADQALAVVSSHLGDYGPISLQILKIIWINILLSGDNAVVIALACRALPRRQRTWGIILGAAAAVVLRIVFTVGLQFVLELPYLRFVGGVLLIYIAVKLLVQEEASEDSVASSESLWGAVRTVAIADIVMSLDNVLAIAAAAMGQPMLIAFGLLVSIPLIVAGATLIMVILGRFPILVWGGAALLGWIAGQLIVEDPVTYPYFQQFADLYVYGPFGRHATSYKIAEYFVQVICTAFVVLVGWLLMKWQGRAARQSATQKSAAKSP
jgi:YjbE family integral membrane protein